MPDSQKTGVDATDETAPIPHVDTATGVTAPKPLDGNSDERLAEIVATSGLVSRTEVQTCMKELEEARGRGEEATLAGMLVKHEALTEHQAKQFSDAVAKEDSGELIGGYSIIDELGEGGMGKVYMAVQLTLDRVVALKVLSEQQASNPTYIERFLREAKVAARLENPNIVRAIDAGESRGRYYFAMEWVEGRPFGDVIDEHGKIPESQAIDIAIQASRGLECASQNGLVHRDIKPDNLLITYQGVLKIADLGLAKEIHGDEAGLTRDNIPMGTPHYVSPEQAKAETVDIRSDIYSLGVTLYYAVTGKQPFQGSDPLSVVVARLTMTPKTVREVNPEISLGFSQIIETMMAVDPKNRHPDPTVLTHDLELLSQGMRPEFAGGTKSSRKRAISASRQGRNTISSLLAAPMPEVKKRPRATLFVAAALVLVLGGAAAFTLRSQLGFVTELVKAKGPPAANENSSVAARRLELEASALHRSAMDALENGLFDDAEKMIRASGSKFAATSFADKLKEVLSLTRERRTTTEDRDERHSVLVRIALTEAAMGDYVSARTHLQQAQEMKPAAELRELAKQIERAQYLKEAMTAEIAGDLPSALPHYENVLAIADDSGLSDHVAEIKRKLEARSLLEKARALAKSKAWSDAKEAYAKSIALCENGTAEVIRIELKSVELEGAYAAALNEAQDHIENSRWQAAANSAKRALQLKPDAAVPKNLIAKARRSAVKEKEITNSLDMGLVLIPDGEFTMGHPEGSRAERPEHEVKLDAFYVGKYEVTNAQFEEFDPSRRTQRTQFSAADDMPVVNVTWRDAVYFCRWLSAKEGKTYRLPTEAEWERAARIAGGQYPWGDEPVNEGDAWRCNVAAAWSQKNWGVDGHKFAATVGSYPSGATPLGVHDMAGNAREWCSDWHVPDYYSMGNAVNPLGPDTGTEKITRGGAYSLSPSFAPSYKRLPRDPNEPDADLGFRVVMELD